MQLRGLAATTAWWSRDNGTDCATGSGDFAEVFAVWLVGAKTFHSTLAARPTVAQLTKIRTLFT